VTDTSSKGLLPQLTDVLYALTDSHELLLRKLQTVRLERVHGEPVTIETLRETQRLANAEQLDPALAEMAIATTTVVDDAPQMDASHEVEQTPPPASTPLGRHEPDSGSGVSAVSALSDGETPMQSRSATETELLRPSTETEVASPSDDVDADLSARAPMPTDPSIAGTDMSPGESGERNYNFFDDLDARLTSLTNPESDSAEH
jgi:hypothetical protein